MDTRVNVQLEHGIPIAAVREAMALADAEDAAIVRSTPAGPAVPASAVSTALVGDGITSPNDGRVEFGEEALPLSFQIDLSTLEGMAVLNELRKQWAEWDDETDA